MCVMQHPLGKWLGKNRVKQADFARSIGCSEPHLSLVAQGKRGVSLELALSIERETHRGVTVEQLLDSKLEAAE